MLLIQHHQESIEHRLLVIGVPRYTVRPFIDLLCKWEQHSGVIWTIKRLKSLKVDLIRRKSGLKPLTWVRRNRKGDLFGVLGSIFRWSDRSEKCFAKALQAMQAYTFYILPSLTEEQRKKFLSAVGDNPDYETDPRFLSEFRKSVRNAVGVLRPAKEPQPLVCYQGSSEKKSPRPFGRRSVKQSDQPLDDLQWLNSDGGLATYLMFERIFRPLLNGMSRRKYLDWVSSNRRSHNRFIPPPNPRVPIPSLECGEVHFLQEPGGKLRSVASPFRILQQATRPIGNLLYELVSQLPWDCTFDQSKAIPHLQERLSKSLPVHSIDLSSATDRFPFDIQRVVLETILSDIDRDYIDLIEQISRGTWKSSIGSVKWVKGQPLGLYPSFALFTLSHGLVLYHLNQGWNQDFFVVGDDVVILKDDLKDKYVDFLEKCGCPFSQDKSISSSLLCEFAGKIVLPSGVIPQLKWRQMSNDNFLDICRLLGPQSRSLLTPRQRVIFDKVATLCLPVGLNFNPKGIPLEVMVQRTLEAYRPEEVILGSLMGLRSRILSRVYSTTEEFDSQELDSICTTFDEKVVSALSKTIFARWSLSNSICLDAFSTLPAALDLEPRLPLREFSSIRRSTLERYERLFIRS